MKDNTFDQKERKIVNEILNDAFWQSFILELKRNISDLYQKEILSNFLIFFSSIFAEETIKAGFGGMSEKTTITEKEVSKFRNHNLKYCTKIDSATTLKTISEMGISFDEYIFDIVLTIRNSEVMDINFRGWDYSKEENFNLLDGTVSTPNVWMEKLMPEIYDQMIELLKDLSKKYINQISNSEIKKRSYSTFKLFARTKIDAENKLYVLQRYGLVKTMMFINDLINEEIKISIHEAVFDSKLFIIKCKSILLELFWNDKKSNPNLSVLNEIFSLNKESIPAEFYAINRRIRDNLHYSDYHYLTDTEMEILKTYQDIYFKNIIKVFDAKIDYKFGLGYKLGLSIAKILKWSEG